MPRWIERLLAAYLVARTLGGVSLFLLVVYLIIREA